MSIADKITSITNHLIADWEAIENLGGSAEDKNIENIATSLNEIYNNIPKTTDTGINLSLSTIKGKMEIIPKGDTSQSGTPTPDSPQPIEVVTGTQEVKVENVNLCENATTNANAGAYANILLLDMDLKPNTTYTISFKGASGNKIYLNENITTSQYFTCTGSRESRTFTTKSTIDTSQYIAGSGWIIFKNQSANTETPSFNNVQIEYGSTATTYTPHQEQTQTISLGDIELCKIGNYQDYLYKTSGKQLFDNTNYEQGYSYNTSGTKVANTNWGIYYLPCQANETYTISGLKAYTSVGIVQLDNTKTLVSVLASRTSATTYTITSTQVGYIGISFVWNSNASLGGELNTMMINYGSTALPYEPYGSDKWYKKEQIGKVVLNGSETWTKDSNRYWTGGITDMLQQSGRINLYLNYFHYEATGITAGVGFGYASFGGQTGIIFCYPDTSITTAEQMKTWLSTHNTEVYYPLQTANDIEITDETLIEQLNNLEKLMSYNGTTNISSSGSLPIVLGVSALKGV